jgi:hypothetical protein
MIKKDFQAVADIIKTAKEKQEKEQLENTPLYIAEHIADYFKEQNNLFDYSRFFKACGF